jgi:hypothetical protein
MLLGVKKKRAYVTNDVVRMVTLNCFEEFLSLSLLLKYCNSLIGLCLCVKKTKIVINEIVQMGGFISFKELP